MVKQYPCHKLPKSQRCDCNGPGGFMGHTCGPQRTRTLDQIISEHLSFGLVSKRWKDSIRFLALGCAGEAGELANDVKKEWRGDRKYRGKAGKKLFREKIESETVDLGNYVAFMAKRLGIDLEARMEAKLIEVEQRDDDWNKVTPSSKRAASKGKRFPRRESAQFTMKGWRDAKQKQQDRLPPTW